MCLGHKSSKFLALLLVYLSQMFLAFGVCCVALSFGFVSLCVCVRMFAHGFSLCLLLCVFVVSERFVYGLVAPAPDLHLTRRANIIYLSPSSQGFTKLLLTLAPSRVAPAARFQTEGCKYRHTCRSILSTRCWRDNHDMSVGLGGANRDGIVPAVAGRSRHAFSRPLVCFRIAPLSRRSLADSRR